LRKNVKLKLIGVKLKISSTGGKSARLKNGKDRKKSSLLKKYN
jgi:hypothetical protein